MALTTSQSRLRRREAGWEGRRRRNRKPLPRALALLGAALLGGVAEAQKKKKKTVNIRKAVNLPIPDALPDPGGGIEGTHGVLLSTINVPKKKFKRLVVAADSVKVTFQTAGFNPDSAQDISARLRNPKGRTVNLGTLFVGQSIGPFTQTPNSPVQRCDELVDPCPDPNDTVRPPYFGTVGNNGLANYTGTKVNGGWALEIQDTENGNLSNLVSWSLNITTSPAP